MATGRGAEGLDGGRHERRAAYPNPRVRPWYAAGPMSATADAPAHFRRGAARPGPIGLLREAVVEVTQRRRLIRYLVQADVRKKGADTFLGNLWWVIDPLLQMAVYVVLVSVVFERGDAGLPALHLRRDPALEVVPDDRRRRHHVGHRRRIA